MLAEIWGFVCKVLWWFLGWMSPIVWLTENLHEERNQGESEPDEYYDAVDSGESRTPGIWDNSDLDSEVRRRVNLELTQQLRELRESLLQEREAGLREWDQRAGNAWDQQVGEPVCFSTPVEPRTNNVSVRHPQEGQLVSPIGGSGVYSEHGPVPTQTGGQSPSVQYGGMTPTVTNSFQTAPQSWQQDSVHSNRVRCKPEKYDGCSDWSDYLRHFQKVADWNEWNDREKAAQLSMNLSGLARQAWADSFCDSATEVTYDALVTALTQRFKPEGQEEAYKAEFRRRVRKAEETFLEFGYSLRRLAIRAFPKLAHEAREDLVIDQFLLGLSDAEMRRHVSLAHPGCVDKAITLATEYETITQSIKSPVPQKPKQVAAVASSSESSCSQGDETHKLLSELVGLIKSQQSWRPGKFKRKAPLECWGCGQVGHKLQECTHPVGKDQPEEAGGKKKSN